MTTSASLLRVAALVAAGVASASAAAQTACESLPGRWTGTQTIANGVTVTTTLAFGDDYTFQGDATANGAAYWSYTGSWACKGSTLSWTFAKSSRELSDTARNDTDELVAADASRLVLRSAATGTERSFIRVK